MNNYPLSNQPNNHFLKWVFNIPAILRVFILVVFIFVLFHISTMFFSSAQVRLNYYGAFGVNAGNMYMSVLFSLGLMVFQKKDRNVPRIMAILFLLVIVCLYFLPHTGSSHSYAKGTFKIRFLWSVVVPLLGVAIMLFSPKVAQYCKPLNKSPK